MSDMPELRTRNLGNLIGKVVDTHEQIVTGILDRATEHADYLKSRNAELNAAAKLEGKA